MLKLLLLAAIALSLQAKHKHPESYYQKIFCDKMGGVMEYPLDDKTRVDCLTKTHAIEIDFASKFYEAIGQSLYYSIKTGKKAGVYLIIENDSELKYLDRLNAVSQKYGIEIWADIYE